MIKPSFDPMGCSEHWPPKVFDRRLYKVLYTAIEKKYTAIEKEDRIRMEEKVRYTYFLNFRQQADSKVDESVMTRIKQAYCNLRVLLPNNRGNYLEMRRVMVSIERWIHRKRYNPEYLHRIEQEIKKFAKTENGRLTRVDRLIRSEMRFLVGKMKRFEARTFWDFSEMDTMRIVLEYWMECGRFKPKLFKVFKRRFNMITNFTPHLVLIQRIYNPRSKNKPYGSR